MKKLISVLLAAVMLCVSLASLTSCGSTVTVRMTVKDYGTVDIELDKKAAPKTVRNFVKLVKDGFYDGLTFHRVVDGFMIQGGCPKGDGTGSTDPIPGEFLVNGHYNPIAHERGVISMARGEDYDSGSCQFFIVHQTSDNNRWALDGNYAAFGRVIAGMEVVDAIVENAEYGASSEYVTNPAVIESIVIVK
ncbi:MAG: peptidylprolyl isomerase [Clostridia bacterium]|nr:peptidylprolyl isomerase [Clostridia bacterium]